MQSTFSPCLPTSGKVVPATSAWLHEVKYDGYRLIVARDGDRAGLFTRNGHDWSGRFPQIVETALRNRHKQFVIDGEAVLLGVDGVSHFNGLHSRRQDEEVQLYGPWERAISRCCWANRSSSSSNRPPSIIRPTS